MTDCPICRDRYLADESPSGKGKRFTCQRCGRYLLTGSAEAELSHVSDQDARMLLSGTTRRAWEDGVPLELTTYKLQDVLRQGQPRRRSLFERADQFLLYLADRTVRPFKNTQYHTVLDFTLLGFTSEEGMHDAANFARELDFVSANAQQLTVRGWRRVEELRSHRPNSRKAFVAMWFDDDLDDAWHYGFKKGIEDTDYFEALRMKELEHNEKIDDRIVGEIRTAGLVVADFTGHRGGVYFEAGFAMGLGIPVIWTCRKDDMEDLHFDTRQYNHIEWSDPDELRGKLTARILAVVPAATDR